MSIRSCAPRATFLVLATLALFAAGCPGAPPKMPPSAPAAKGPAEEPLVVRQSKTGRGFRLSNEDASADAPPPRNVAAATSLAAADAKKIAARMPALPDASGDAKAFSLREGSRPAPRAGRTVNEAFPPPPPATNKPSTGAGGPLVVERHAPEGPVELAPHFSITFSQPMVPVSSIEAVTADKPPVIMTPQPAGKWRWLGTRTVVFQPEKRFPMATEYVAVVPAGTKSQLGGALAREERFTFTTPPVKVEQVHPTGTSVVLDPVIVVRFDQAVEPTKILGSLELAANGRPVPLRVATSDEVEADATARRLVQQAEPGRVIALRPEGRLANETFYRVGLRAGAPSAEGPRRTTSEQGQAFKTFGPMRLSRSGCYERSCKPLEALPLEFSNAIDESKFDKGWVSITPELPGAKLQVAGQTLLVQGRTKGRTKYTVTVKGALADVHGQTLGRDVSADVQVGTADPMLFGAERDMVVLDPAEPRAYPVYSVNEPGLRTRLYAVAPSDHAQYRRYTQDWERPRIVKLPGRLVSEKVLTPRKAPDELVSTPVDLAPALKNGKGQVLLVVESTRTPPKGYERASMHVWIQSTDLGLQAYVDGQELAGWVSRLDTGAPIAGAELEVLGADGASAKTDASGVGRVPLGAKGAVLVAKLGGDLAILPHGDRWSSDPFAKRPESDALRWLVYDDRGMYKPGEKVRLKGWLRAWGTGKGGDLSAVPNVAGAVVAFRVRDARWSEIVKGEAKVDAAGSFDLAFDLPGNVNLGSAAVELSLDGGVAGALFSSTRQTHRFEVQEFRRPEFEVSARTSEGPHLVGRHATATVTASYFAGGGLAAAPVTWRVAQEQVPFTPPNRSDFHFGPAAEPWGVWWRAPRARDKSTSETWSAKTDAAGAHRLRVDFDALEPSFPMRLELGADVEDVNRQQWSARTSLLVHPADRTVGLRLAKGLVRSGDSADVDVLVTDLDGKAEAGRAASVKLVRLETERKGNTWEEREIPVASCEVTSKVGPDEASRCALRTGEGGAYKVVAVVTDAAGRKSQSEVRVWVVGNETPKDRGLARDSLQLVPDAKDHDPGKGAELLVVAPFTPAEGVLTVRRQGVVRLERFTMTSATQVLRVPLEDAMVPGVTARVDLVGAAVRTNAAGAPDASLPKRPAFASGEVLLGVLPKTRKLAVSATPKASVLGPGAKTDIVIDVKDAEGKPVPDATVAVVVADEAVLALSGYATPDPIAAFYPGVPAGVTDLATRELVLLADPDLAALKGRALSADAARGGEGGAVGYGRGMSGRATARPMATMAAEMAPGAPPPPPSPVTLAQAAKPDASQREEKKRSKEAKEEDASVSSATTAIAVRSNFDALALFAPRVTTDRGGRATVALALPDNLTRYRVMAVVSAGGKAFGVGESTVTARLPVMARLSAPRFLNFGDRFELPVVVQNQTDAPVDVGIVLRGTNATIAEPSAKRVRVPANDRVEVRFETATVSAGTARFQIGVASGGFADGSQVELPVYTPATTEAFATYGEIDEGAIAQKVVAPANVFPQFGGLELTTSSTQLQALTDAFLYLVRYPYECNEQLSSRVLSIAALRDVLSAFKAEDMPKPEALAAFVKEDMDKLRRRQKWDGGWGFWEGEAWPYLSVHVTHALVRAKAKGYQPDGAMMARAQQYLRSIESKFPAWYPPETRRSITAYALYVRKLMGDPDQVRAHGLVVEAGGVEKLPMEAVGWLWPTMSDAPGTYSDLQAIRRHVANRAEETAGAAHFTSGYQDGGWVLLHSDRRADGVLLEALIKDQPDSTLIPKLVKGLLAHRKKGRWTNTQENAFVLLALDRYFATYEKATPDFVARAWLGDRFAGEHAFKGRTTEQVETKIPMAWLQRETKGAETMVLAKEGPGRLYYRLGMSYAPTDLKLPPTDQGFVVSRVYEAVDKPEEVRRDPDGAWRVKAGARVRTRVTMVAPARRYHVALVDPLPAGLEPMNAALAVTGEIPKDPKAEAQGGKYGMWQRTWYEHQNLRDERAEAFASLLWDGVWDYAYVSRATTPGTFVVPPAKAEEMYAPETFGRSAGDRVIVE